MEPVVHLIKKYEVCIEANIVRSDITIYAKNEEDAKKRALYEWENMRIEEMSQVGELMVKIIEVY